MNNLKGFYFVDLRITDETVNTSRSVKFWHHLHWCDKLWHLYRWCWHNLKSKCDKL